MFIDVHDFFTYFYYRFKNNHFILKQYLLNWWSVIRLKEYFSFYEKV